MEGDSGESELIRTEVKLFARGAGQANVGKSVQPLLDSR